MTVYKYPYAQTADAALSHFQVSQESGLTSLIEEHA